MGALPGIGTAIASNLPGEVQVAGKVLLGQSGRVGAKVIRAGAQFVGRFFRSKKPKLGVHPGIRTARGGSAITKGKLDLGGGQAFKAGGTSFNVATAAKAGVAAVGVGGAVAVGKVVRPTAAVHVAMGGTNTAPRVSFSSPAPRAVSRAASSPASSPGPASSSGRQKRCGCPPGQRMLCFKRKHNPEAEAKRRAKRKAARASSKAKTAKRTARAKAQAHARKTARHTRAVNKKVRKAVRRVTRGRRR